MDIKAILKSNKGKISAIVGAVVFVAIGVYVGDVTIGQLKDCVLSFDLQSAQCQLITLQTNP
jgi:hypothetical protein